MTLFLKFLFGQKLALALEFVTSGLLLLESLYLGGSPNLKPFSSKLFSVLPTPLKAPTGPATETEFIDAVQAVFHLFRKK
jgi:hypothetical protein